MKLIFIDIDGTLIEDHGAFPDSAKKAIETARKNGHLVFINTGRSRSQVFKYIEDIGFDGIVCSDGMYVEYKGEVLKKESLSKEQIDIINKYFSENKIGYMAEGHSKFLVNNLFITQMRNFVGNDNYERFSAVFPYSGLVEKIPYDEIAKVNFPVKNDYSEELQKKIGSLLHVGFFTDGDGKDYGMMYISLPNANKMNGVDFILDYLKLDNAETYAFGDTKGDLGMVKGCTYGIAMGNGEQILKDNADFVTDTVAEDGLYKAMVKFGLV